MATSDGAGRRSPAAVDTDPDGELEGEERPEHEQVAVGEVDQLDDAVDHRVAEGDQGVERAR